MPSSLRYGTAELKLVHNRNLAVAFGISVGIHLFAIGLYRFATMDGTSANVVRRFVTSVTTITTFGATDSRRSPNAATNQRTDGPPTSLGDYRAGRPAPVNDSKVPDSIAPFASVGELATAMPEPGSSGLPNISGETPAGPIRIEQPVRVAPEDPSPTDFVADAVEPQVDYEALQSRVVYPEVARRNGIRGQVVVRVLIDATGSPVRYLIDYSDNKLLEQAAANAVMSMPFSPGRQNDVPVKLWVSVPIRFELE